MASKVLNTADLAVGQQNDIVIRGGQIMTNTAIEPAGTALNKEYLSELAFMEEEITIRIMESTDDNAENPVNVGVNGSFVQIHRGVDTRVKRKFVNGLFAKSSRVTTPKVKNGAGDDAFAIRQTAAHKFPFVVVEDRNPKGSEWVRQRMADVH